MSLENDLGKKIWKFATFTKMGAITLAQTMQKKYKCTILSEPKQNKDGQWEFTFTNPFKGDSK